MKVLKSATVLVVFLLVVVATAHGQQFSPPPEAYKACEGKKVGDPSQFVNPRGETVQGKCEERDGKLILRPDRPEGKSGGKSFNPPPEAYKACEGKRIGDASQFVNPRGETVMGICKERDGKLILRPDRLEGKSGGKSVGPPPEAYKACEGKKVGDASQFVNPRGETVMGKCVERDGKLILHPDHPKTVN